VISMQGSGPAAGPDGRERPQVGRRSTGLVQGCNLTVHSDPLPEGRWSLIRGEDPLVAILFGGVAFPQLDIAAALFAFLAWASAWRGFRGLAAACSLLRDQLYGGAAHIGLILSICPSGYVIGWPVVRPAYPREDLLFQIQPLGRPIGSD